MDDIQKTEAIESLIRRQQELEESLRETRKALAEAMERQNREFNRIDLRLGQVQARTDLSFREVRSVLNSRIWRSLAKAGGALFGGRPRRGDQSGIDPDGYARWIADFDTRDPEFIQFKLRDFQIRPLISVLIFAEKADPRILERTIRSVKEQSYSNWEVCLPGGQNPPRGEYAALLEAGDELARDALFHIVDALQREPRADIFYSDEDRIDEHGNRSDPLFKPDWSPNLMLSGNYAGNLLVFRRELAETAGGIQGEDYDLLLRMSVKAGRIVHVPRILYHGRASDKKEKAISASRGAIENYLRIAGINATVEPGRVTGRWRIRYALSETPLVSIIIPSGGQVEILRKNLDTLAAITDYPNYEIILADNSRAAAIESFGKSWKRNGRTVRYFDWRNHPFNYSEINNAAARTCESPLLLFLNDDTIAIEDDWLTAMVEQACRPRTGAVGARLLFPDGRIQHAGVVMGLFGICGHAFKGMPGDRRTYCDLADVIRDVSALTAACLMTPSKVFREVGGFDEVRFPVAYNDIDLTLRIGARGYQLIYTPHASLYHMEAFSKAAADLDPQPAETAALCERWRHVITRDPFYNPNLTVVAEDFSLRKKA